MEKDEFAKLINKKTIFWTTIRKKIKKRRYSLLQYQSIFQLFLYCWPWHTLLSTNYKFTNLAQVLVSDMLNLVMQVYK